MGGNIEKEISFKDYDINKINNNFLNKINSNEYLRLKNENEKLIKENISLKQELINTLNELKQYKEKDNKKDNNNKQIEYKLSSLQNKLEAYETSLENTKTQYEEQINIYQKEISNYNNIITIINSFFNHLSNNFNIIFQNNNILNGKEFEDNLEIIKKYIFNLNEEIKKYKAIIQKEKNNYANEREMIQENNKSDFFWEKDRNHKNIFKYNFMFDETTKISNNINNEDNNLNINNENELDYQNNLKEYKYTNNNKSNNEYKSLEQRILMLENELKFQKNKNKENFTGPRINYNINDMDDSKNKIIFQNDILAEKVKTSDLVNNDTSKIKKMKKKKKKKKIEKIEFDKRHDNSDIIYYNTNNYKSFIINKDKSNKKSNSRRKYENNKDF